MRTRVVIQYADSAKTDDEICPRDGETILDWGLVESAIDGFPFLIVMFRSDSSTRKEEQYVNVLLVARIYEREVGVG